MEIQADRVAEIAGRPLARLNRRDVALTLLRVPADDAIASLPGIRRAMLAAGNPLSAAFWDSAEAILNKIKDTEATFGDVHTWLEATGTEPAGIIGLHVWDEQAERSPLQEEMHARLITYLEERLADGDIDPDLLVTGDADARQEYLALQERWMTSPLPDGRVPMTVLLDEQDQEFDADWAAADEEASNSLRSVLDRAGDRPMPEDELLRACSKLRDGFARPGWPGDMLAAFSGRNSQTLPADDTDLWLTLAAAVASPGGTVPENADDVGGTVIALDGDALTTADVDLDEDEEDDENENALADGEPDEISGAMASVTALDHFDWLAVLSALAAGGPGTPASAADLARYVRDFDPDSEEAGELGAEVDEFLDADEGALEDDGEFVSGGFDDEFDELSIEGLFLHVTSLWSVLGAIDADDRLTNLGWWGLPEAMQRVWGS